MSPFAPGGDLCVNRHSGESLNPESPTPLTLSLSKGLSGTKGWFDKLTMSGYAKVSFGGRGGQRRPLLPSPLRGRGSG